MREQSNLESREAQEVRQRSEFLKRITEFARFMQKEYIEESDGDMAMMICAGDSSVGNNQTGHAEIMMGGKPLMAYSLADMMKDEKYGQTFRIARMMAADSEAAMGDVKTLERRVRRLYVTIAGLSAWTLVLVAMQLVGIANWITTVSNLLLMGFLISLVVRDLQQQRSRLRQARRDHREACEAETMKKVSQMLSRIAAEMNGDDDDE